VELVRPLPVGQGVIAWRVHGTPAEHRADDPKAPLNLGDEVTAHLVDGTSITLRLTARRIAPYRVVTLSGSRPVSGWTRHFGSEAEARGFARAAILAHYTGGDIASTIVRADGRQFHPAPRRTA